jgi:hypothetical protein
VKQRVPEEKEATQDNGEATELKDPWEESGCILWDLAASKPQAELMVSLQYLCTICLQFKLFQLVVILDFMTCLLYHLC